MSQIVGWLYCMDTIPSSDWNWYCILYEQWIAFCLAIWAIKLNFVFLSVVPHFYFITPSSTPLFYTLVFLPQLYLLSLGFPSVLPDWCAGLQICMSETVLIFVIFHFFQFLLVLPFPANMAHPYLLSINLPLYFRHSSRTHIAVSVLLCVLLLVCLQFFNCVVLLCCIVVVWVVYALLQAAVESIMKEKMPKKGGRWWFSWRGRNSSSKSVIFTFVLFDCFHVIC